MADINYELVLIAELGRSDLAPETDGPRWQDVVNGRARASASDNSLEGEMLQGMTVQGAPMNTGGSCCTMVQ